MATPDATNFTPDQPDLNHTREPAPQDAAMAATPPSAALPAADTLPNGTTATNTTQQADSTPGTPIARPATSPIQSPMRGPTPDTHMNGTDDEPPTAPQQQQPAPLLQQTQQTPAPAPAPAPTTHNAAPPPPLQSHLQSQFHTKDAPSPSPTSTPAPAPSSTRYPAHAATPAETVPTQMANNEHGSDARVYINSRITPTLLEGMKWVAKHEPDKPLKWLSEFLARRSAELEGA